MNSLYRKVPNLDTFPEVIKFICIILDDNIFEKKGKK